MRKIIKCLLIISLLVTSLFLFYLLIKEGVHLNQLKPIEKFIFLYGILWTVIGLLNSFDGIDKSDRSNSIIFHQNIGGYIPSKEVDALVAKSILKKGGTITLGKTKFSTNLKDTKQLEKYFDVIEISQDQLTNVATCKGIINNVEYKTVSASKEMAICLTFLKLCGEIK